MCDRRMAVLYDAALCDAEAVARAAARARCPVTRTWRVDGPGVGRAVAAWRPHVVVRIGPAACDTKVPGRRLDVLCPGRGLALAPPVRQVVRKVRRFVPRAQRVALLGGRASRRGATVLEASTPEQVIARILEFRPTPGDVVVMAPRPELFPPPVFGFLVRLQARIGTVLVGFTQRHVALGAALAVGWPPEAVGRALAEGARKILRSERAPRWSGLLGEPVWWYNRMIARVLGPFLDPDGAVALTQVHGCGGNVP